MTGRFRETVDFDPGPGTANLSSTENDAIYVAKYDASGAYQWAFQIGPNSSNHGFGIAIDGQGNVLVTGGFGGTADFDPGAGTAGLTSNGGRDIFVAKYSSAGAYLWAINMGGASNDRAFAINVDGSDNVLVSGNFQGTADFDPGSGTATLTAAGAFDSDIFVAKYSSSGAYQWAFSLGAIGSDQGGRAIAVDGSDNVLVTGDFYGTADFDPGVGTAILSSAGDSDAFVAKYSSSGAYLWAFSLGDAGFDRGQGVAVDGSDNVLVTGTFQGTVDFDPGAGTVNYTSAGWDGYLAKYSPAGTYLWAFPLGGTSSDDGNGIAVDGSDNVLVTGRFVNTVDFDPASGLADLTSAGSGDIFLAKYDDSGAYLWAISMGGASSDQGNGIVVDGSGNALVMGTFRIAADFDPGPGDATLSIFENDNNDDVFIAKYNAMGAYQWAGQIGFYSTSPKFIETNSVAADALHNSYITGYLRGGTADFDPGPGTVSLSATGDDIFVAKYDASGAYQWAFKLGGNSSERGRGIAVDGLGNVLVTGGFSGTVDFDPGPNTFSLTSIGLNDAFIAKYDASGAYQWAINMGGANVGVDGYGIAVDGSNNVLVTGSFTGTVDFDPGPGVVNLTSAGISDIFVAKYNPSGNLQWATKTGGADNDQGFAIALNSSGEVLVAGRSANESFVAKYDASGVNQWAFTMVGFGSAEGVAVDGSGNVLVTGDFDGTIDFDPGTGTANLTSSGSQDAFVAKYSGSGSYQWAFSIITAGVYSASGSGIAADISDKVFVTGWFSGTADFDPGLGTANLTSAGDYDIFVARYDALGNYLDAFSVGNTKEDRGKAIAMDGLGNPFVAGFFEKSADFDPQAGTTNLVSLNRSDGFLARYSYCTPSGDPTVFGDNVWNVYAWNAGGPSITGNAWNLNYAGYYEETNLNINTETRWNAAGAPSDASGYAGCAVGADNHSYSYKRKGFPQDVYSLSIDGHDDAAQLWINGTMVWEHDGCCDAHPNVWLGTLGANDEVEFRVTEGGGGSAAYLSFATPCPQGNIVYVNDDAPGANDGSSWTDAFTDLQDALALANSCPTVTQIWVAAGTYKPTSGTDRSISFTMINDVAIYGGFIGTETQLSERDWVANATILSGNIGGAGNADNSYRVIDNDFTAGDPLNSSAVLDGFTLQGAYADGSFPLNLGGGMWNSYASPTIRNCIFRNNYAVAGGGMFNANAAPTVVNCLFTENTVTAAGAGISNGGGSQLAKITNCTFYGNTGPNTINNQSNAVFTNCIVWGNDGGISGGVVNYSIVQGGYGGTGNLDADPLFVDPANGDFTLQDCSPAINSGYNSAVPPGITTDLNGDPRFYNNGPVDRGAFEYQPQNQVVLYVNKLASGNNDGTSWADAFTGLQDALALAAACFNVSEIWVAEGTYYPTAGADRTISFSMVNGVAIYGGFPDTGNPGMQDRDWTANPTILSGDIGTVGVNTDNSRRIIYNINLDNTAVLDGFTIRDAYNEVFFNGMQGGGMWNNLASPRILNCTFRNNHVSDHGGGVANDYSSPDFMNCLFVENSGTHGGAFRTQVGTPTLTNCTFFGNTASLGGAIAANLRSTNNILTNCILWGNGGETANFDGQTTISYSIVQGGYPGTGNLNVDPLFVDPAAGDFQLQPCSPAIDAGDNGANTTSEDLAGNPRVVDASGSATVDMGAYEFQGMRPNPAPVCQNITVQLGPDNTVTVLASQLNDGSTGCGPLSFLIDGQASLSFDCGGLGQHTATLTVTDAFGSQANCNATITVADDDNPCCAAPAAACKPFTAVLDAGGSATLTAGDVDGGSTYACGLQSIAASPNTFSCADAGPQTVTLTVTDVNNESSSCNAQVTVKDEMPPVARCRNR
ncbi:MAG: hypothetical protein KDD10_00400, partial [Phaeodactylibacter sp.]|nr:hypothetical protein [Phaeodactylibacter sp.]